MRFSCLVAATNIFKNKIIMYGGSSTTFENKLIELVKIYPHLYDKRDTDYSDADKTDAAWEEITQALGLSIHDKRAKERWVTLRQRYTKELRKMKTPAASGAKPKTGWQYYGAMTFLEEHIDMRKSLPVIQVDSDTESSKSETTPSANSTSAQSTVQTHPKFALRSAGAKRKLSPKFSTPTTTSDKDVPSLPKTPVISKDVLLQPTRNETNCIILKSISDSPRPPSNDLVESFLNGLAPSLRKLNAARLLKARKLIQNIVFDLEEEELLEPTMDPLAIL